MPRDHLFVGHDGIFCVCKIIYARNVGGNYFMRMEVNLESLDDPGCGPHTITRLQLGKPYSLLGYRLNKF